MKHFLRQMDEQSLITMYKWGVIAYYSKMFNLVDIYGDEERNKNQGQVIELDATVQQKTGAIQVQVENG